MVVPNFRYNLYVNKKCWIVIDWGEILKLDKNLMWCEYTDMNLVTEALSDFVFTLEMENSTRRLCQRFFSMWYSKKWNEKSNDYTIIFYQFSILKDSSFWLKCIDLRIFEQFDFDFLSITRGSWILSWNSLCEFGLLSCGGPVLAEFIRLQSFASVQ